MYWTVKSVPSPSEDHNISFWVEGWSREAVQGARPEPGVHIEINEEIESDTILIFPKEYRHIWYMEKNKCVLVPAPASSDLPDRQKKQTTRRNCSLCTCDHGFWIEHMPPTKCPTSLIWMCLDMDRPSKRDRGAEERKVSLFTVAAMRRAGPGTCVGMSCLSMQCVSSNNLW